MTQVTFIPASLHFPLNMASYPGVKMNLPTGQLANATHHVIALHISPTAVYNGHGSYCPITTVNVVNELINIQTCKVMFMKKVVNLSR